MNEKLSLPPATISEQLQQQQQQQQQQYQPTHAFTSIDHANYQNESTLTTTPPPPPQTTTITSPTTTQIYNYQQSSNNNAKANEIDGSFMECGATTEFEKFQNIGDGSGGAGATTGEMRDILNNELYRYASVASLGGGGGSGVTILPIDSFLSNPIQQTGATLPSLPNTTTTILKMNSNGSGGSSAKGSNRNSPHKQKMDNATTKRNNFCGCFGCCNGGGGRDDTTTAIDKQRGEDKWPALTFWPALFANLGICALLLGYLLIGSFLFLTIETSGDGGSAAGVVSDPNTWSHTAKHQQQQQQHQQTAHSTLTVGQSSKLYKISEPLLGVTTTTDWATDETAKLKPHESNKMSSSSDFQMNTPTNTSSGRGELGEGGDNGIARAAEAVMVAKQFGLMTKPETEIFNDNRYGNKLRLPTKSVKSLNQQQTQAYNIRSAAATAADSTIGKDIKRADISVDTEIVNGIDMMVNDEAEMNGGDVATLDHSSWGGENVALQRTVENIWDITVSLNILYKENWTKLAALEINKFQDQLVKRLVMDLTLTPSSAGVEATADVSTITTTTNNGQTAQQPNAKSHNYQSMVDATAGRHQSQQQQQRERYWQLQAARQLQWQLQKQQQQQFEWNFATSFLYSLTVVTTVGYGTITPRTTLGRMVTIFYATFGIPLTLVYLSSMGSILAKLASGLCERLLCCCLCRTSTTNKRHTICGFSRQQVSDKKCNLKLQQLQKHQQQHEQQQHTSNSMQPPPAIQSTHLPYCYVRPPADDTLSYGEHSPLSSAHSTRRVHTLRWSLALPLGFCILLLLVYVAFGSLVIALLEQWSLFDGIYFCFMSLTTIGFCDLLPGAHVRPHGTLSPSSSSSATSTLVVWFCSAYILSGLTLTSMCVNMLHDEFMQRMRVVVKFKKMDTTPGKSKATEQNFYSAPP